MFLLPKHETSVSLYGSLGVIATVLFFMWVVGRIVVTAPILDASLHQEMGRRHHERTTFHRLGERTRSGSRGATKVSGVRSYSLPP